MEKGKFSQPRPYRDEERQIEEAFRQVTSQAAPKKRQPTVPEPEEIVEYHPEEETDFPLEESFFPEEPSVIPDEPVIPAETPVPEIPAMPARRKAFFPEEEPEFEAEDEEEYDEPESLLDTIMNFCTENRKWILVGLCAAALVLIVAVIAVFAVGGSRSGSDTILDNVFIADVNVGGMTKSQAVSAVRQATSHAYANQDMVVDLAGTQLILSPKDTGAELDVKAAVDAAYDYGRTGTQAEQERAREKAETEPHYIALLPYLALDTDFIRQELESSAGGTGSTLTQVSYGLEGDYPSLSAENFDETAAQTLVLTMGTPGISFDVDAVYDRILDAYSLYTFLVTVEDIEPTVEPEPVDLQAIYDEFYVAPVDSTVDMRTFAVIPGSYGYEFDLMAAQRLVDNAQYGEVIRIPMLFIEPELLDGDILFRDVLGEHQTQLNDDRSRTANIRLACEAINGTVLQPGDTFSFNTSVGQPSTVKGYKTIAEYVGGELVETQGGGISQAATTLYYCALLSDLEIVSRTHHSFPVSYIDYGMDASVSYGEQDFKFRNNLNYPIQIEASISGSYVTVRILGTDQRDYYVKMDYSITTTHDFATEFEDFEYENAEGYLDGDVIRKGITGYSVKTYKLKYSRETGDLKSRDYEASSRYATVNRLVARVAPPETTAPSETTTPPETTVPPTTAPVETAPPETTVPATVPAETAPQETAAPVTETEASLTPISESEPEVSQPEEAAA